MPADAPTRASAQRVAEAIAARKPPPAPRRSSLPELHPRAKPGGGAERRASATSVRVARDAALDGRPSTTAGVPRPDVGLRVADVYELADDVIHRSADGRAELRAARHRATGQPAIVRAALRAPAPAVPTKNVVELWRKLGNRNRHVLCLYESFLTPTHAIVCMEAVEGITLAQLMAQHGLAPAESRRVFKQLAHGVCALHGAGVCHRLLSLDTVMLQRGAAARAVLIGFAGLGPAAPGKRLVKRVTPALICPPEALPLADSPRAAGGAAGCAADEAAAAVPGGDPAGAADAAAARKAHDAADDGSYEGAQLDMWSLGVLLHTMLCGAPPYASAAEVRAARAYVPPPALEPAAAALLGRLLSPDPARRPSAAELCAHPWVHGADVGADATPCGPPPPDAALDLDVLAHLAETLGYAPADVEASVRGCVEDAHSSAYKVLLDRKRLFVELHAAQADGLEGEPPGAGGGGE